MDGYTEKQVGDMSKENPQIRSQYITIFRETT